MQARRALLMPLIAAGFQPAALLADEAAKQPAAAAQAQAQAPEPTLYIQEYRVDGAHHLGRNDIEAAVYPFLGPGRTKDDVEQARAALEKAYQAKGFQTVSVEIPPQDAKGGIVHLQVVEATVGKLRVRGAHYFSPSQIKAHAPSLAEGRVIDFNQVNSDMVGLSKMADRSVTPTVRAGGAPGTVDVDLNVKETLPLHGSVELNNRYSSNTDSLRLNGALSYSNLWQLGHTLGGSFQVSPESFKQVQIYSGFYTAPVPDVSWLSLTLQGTKQDSNVSTLSSVASAGRGEIIGVRANIELPSAKNFYDSLTFGVDYKHFDQDVTVGKSLILTPITYYPLSLAYSATWTDKDSVTVLDSSLNLHLRGLGSTPAHFDVSRFGADANYIYFRGDLSQTRELPAGFQLYGKIQGQLSDSPLINSEEASGGGKDTVRGYIETVALGDNAIFASLEARTPSISWLGKRVNEWRFYTFLEGGDLTIKNALPQEASHFDLASFGAGTKIRLDDAFNGSVDFGIPILKAGTTAPYDLLVTFRIWAEF